MKKLIVAFFVFILSFSMISFVQNMQDNLENGFYYLAENEKDSKLVYDIDTEEVFGIEKTPILTKHDFDDAYISTATIQSTGKIDFKIIEIKLTNKGRKKWINVKSRIQKSNESIVFVFENKVIIEKSFHGNSNNYNERISLPISNKYAENFLHKIKQEIENYKFKNSKK